MCWIRKDQRLGKRNSRVYVSLSYRGSGEKDVQSIPVDNTEFHGKLSTRIRVCFRKTADILRAEMV